MRSGPFNAPIVIGVANQHGGDAGRLGSLHVERGVTHVPDRRIGNPPEAPQRQMQWGWVGLVRRRGA